MTQPSNNSLKDKEIRRMMALSIACDEMTRIVSQIILPEFNTAYDAVKVTGIPLDMVSYDAESPVHEGEMCELGIKFRCGDKQLPCKIEYIGLPEDFEFSIIIRTPDGESTEKIVSFQEVIPRNIRQLLTNFFSEHFPKVEYKPEINDFDQYEGTNEGPYKVQMDEDGKRSDIATTKTFKEAIKMGATMSKAFKNKTLIITDKEGELVC